MQKKSLIFFSFPNESILFKDTFSFHLLCFNQLLSLTLQNNMFIF